MAKKATPTKKPAAAKAAPVSTPVRNTPIPKVSAVVASIARKAVTHDDIAFKAFLISLSGTGGDETANWLRAERELRGA